MRAIIIPQMYDQHYHARRIDDLGIGAAHAPGAPTASSLASALERTMQPDVSARARTFAPRVRTDGATIAAQRLVAGDL